MLCHAVEMLLSIEASQPLSFAKATASKGAKYSFHHHHTTRKALQGMTPLIKGNKHNTLAHLLPNA